MSAHIICSNAVTAEQLKQIQRNEVKTRTIRKLIKQCADKGIPLPEKEQTDLVPGRHFRPDLLWRDARLIVEYEGGTWNHMRKIDPETGNLMQSRHANPVGFRNDCEKYNLLQIQGYAVLRFDASMVNSEEAVHEIAVAYYTRRVLAEVLYAAEAEAMLKRAIIQHGAMNVVQMLKDAAFDDQDVTA